MIAEFEFDGVALQSAIRATFERRESPLPQALPIALTDEFANEPGVLSRWKGFISRNRIDAYADLKETIAILKNFFEPIILAESEYRVLSLTWTSGRWF